MIMKVKSVFIILGLTILFGQMDKSLGAPEPDVHSFRIFEEQEFQQSNESAPVLVS